MPPTPQPSTPSPLIIVVCESVPMTVSGKMVRPSSVSRVVTTSARYSRFTWCTMPAPGGTSRKFFSAFCAQRRKLYRSMLRSYSRSTFRCNATCEPKKSICTEWSMTRSHGMRGLIFCGSPPIRAIAFRMAARSTSAGMPVRSCISTRASMNGNVRSGCWFGRQLATAAMSASSTRYPSTLRSAFSSRMRIVYGSLSRFVSPSFSR